MRLPQSLQNSDLCLSVDNTSGMVFLTHIFKDGCLLGFWSHSPWGTCTNQETGWAVLDPNATRVLDKCEIKSFGMSAGNDFKEWRRRMKELHGSATKLADEHTMETFWKISEA